MLGHLDTGFVQPQPFNLLALRVRAQDDADHRVITWLTFCVWQPRGGTAHLDLECGLEIVQLQLDGHQAPQTPCAEFRSGDGPQICPRCPQQARSLSNRGGFLTHLRSAHLFGALS
jgi:hypothetical protein